jgi:bifunctional ADP-heptose synthase (sugar kinase/adenylyltransferase)
MNILLIGDAMVDEYLYSTKKRPSPECSDISAYEIERTVTQPGGCLNVLKNLEAMLDLDYEWQHRIFPVIMTRAAKTINYKQTLTDYYYVTPIAKDTKKVRLMYGDPPQQILRIDLPCVVTDWNIEDYKQKLFECFKKEQIDAAIISDYQKGGVTSDVIKLLETAKFPVFIDTKNPYLSIWEKIPNAILKLNAEEYRHARNLHVARTIIRTDKEKEITFLRLDKSGCFTSTKLFETFPVENPNPIGAGDVFLAGLVAEYTRTKDLEKSITYANMAARVSVQKPGTPTITHEEVINEFEKFRSDRIKNAL